MKIASVFYSNENITFNWITYMSALNMSAGVETHLHFGRVSRGGVVADVKFINLYGQKVLLLLMQMSQLSCQTRFNYTESPENIWKNQPLTPCTQLIRYLNKFAFISRSRSKAVNNLSPNCFQLFCEKFIEIQLPLQPSCSIIKWSWQGSNKISDCHQDRCNKRKAQTPTNKLPKMFAHIMQF